MQKTEIELNDITIKIPRSLDRQVTELLKKQGAGYLNKNDFYREAIREKVRRELT